MQKQLPEATVCSDPGAYVEARVLQRLIDRGVPIRRAEHVARKVRKRYDHKRYETLLRSAESSARARALTDELVARSTLYRGYGLHLDRVQRAADGSGHLA